MPDRYELKHGDQFLKAQYENKLQEISEDLNENLRNQNSDVIKTIIDNITEILNNNGKPSFKNRQESRAFDSTTYNNNIREIFNDINTLYNLYYDIQNTSHTINDTSDIYNDLLSKNLSKTEKIIDDIKDHDREQTEVLNIKELFRDKENLDTNNTDAHINATSGVVTLNNEVEEDNALENNVEIKIMDDSNGYPGRLFQLKNVDETGISYVQSTGEEFLSASPERYDDGPIYYSEEDPHINLRYMLDGNSDTHFEYSAANFLHEEGNALSDTSEDIRTGTKLYGAFFDNDELWAKDPKDGLKLHLQITLKEAKELNYLNISKYEIDYPGYEHFQIEKIKTSPSLIDEMEPIDLSAYQRVKDLYNIEHIRRQHEIAYDDNIEHHKIITFPPRKIKVIDMILKQDLFYNCPIGHTFFKDIPDWYEFDSLFDYNEKDKLPFGRRIEGLRINKEALIEEANLTFDETEKESEYLEETEQESKLDIINSSNVAIEMGPAGGLASSNLTSVESVWGGDKESIRDENVIMGIDVLDGRRFAIAIDELYASKNLYKEESIIVSQNYRLSGDIRKIWLKVDDYIPLIFSSDISPSTSETDLNEWVKYYFSLNDGEDWHKIIPQKRAGSEEPSIYHVNINERLNYTADNEKTIENALEQSMFKFKIVLSRPTDFDRAEYYTPRINKVNFCLEYSGGE